MDAPAEGAAEHGAEEDGGKEASPRRSRPERRRRRRQLHHERDREGAKGQLTGERCVHRLDAGAEDARRDQREEPDGESADRRAKFGTHAGKAGGESPANLAREQFLRGVHGADVEHGGAARGDAEQKVDGDLARVMQRPRHRLQLGAAAEQRARGRRRGDAGEHDGREAADAEIGQHDLEREHRARQRRLERRGDPCSRSAGEQHGRLAARQGEETSERSSHGATQMDDRAFLSGASAGTDDEACRQGFPHRDAPAQLPATPVDRLDHFDDAVAAALWTDVSDDQAGGERAKPRRENAHPHRRLDGDRIQPAGGLVKRAVERGEEDERVVEREAQGTGESDGTNPVHLESG